MNEQSLSYAPDQLSRVVKLAVDSGEVHSVEHAFALFKGYRVRVRVGSSIASSAAQQATLLTVINAGRRSFLGGVTVEGPESALNAALLVNIPRASTVVEAVRLLGGLMHHAAVPPCPEIWIGDVGADVEPDHEICVRATYDGWRAAAVQVRSADRLSEYTEFAPSAVLAGALAVSEVFQHFRGDTVDAGRRDVGLSLWSPEANFDWRLEDGAPRINRLPSRLWLLGLGHLGQAYLWTLGLLPYADPSEVELVLQDIDTLELANESTSLLTHESMRGQMKTRAMATWAEARGFRTRIVEREFAANFQIGANEPRLLLGGVDNRMARAHLEDAGFATVIDAGLGTGGREYLSLQVHSFPAHSRTANQLWGAATEASMNNTLLSQPAYRALAESGIDDCGLTKLAGRSVGASFVGATTAALVIAEAIRAAIGAHRYAVVDATLRGLDRRTALRNERTIECTNLGLTSAYI